MILMLIEMAVMFGVLFFGARFVINKVIPQLMAWTSKTPESQPDGHHDVAIDEDKTIEIEPVDLSLEKDDVECQDQKRKPSELD